MTGRRCWWPGTSISSRCSTLARNMGMSPGTPLELAEPLQLSALRSPADLKPWCLRRLLARADYLSLASQRQGLVEQQRANAARWYPKLSVNGNFGGMGRSIGGVLPTGMIQGQIDFTVFDRDRNGEAQELASRIKRIDDQIADLRRGIEEDMREALLNLDSSGRTGGRRPGRPGSGAARTGACAGSVQVWHGQQC